MSKSRVPDHLKRVFICGRISPRSMAYLRSLGQPNAGRAIDYLVEAHRAIRKALSPEMREKLDHPAPLPIAQPKA